MKATLEEVRTEYMRRKGGPNNKATILLTDLAVIGAKLSIKIRNYTKELAKTEKSLFNSPWAVKHRIDDEVFEKVFGMDRRQYMDKMWKERRDWRNRDEFDDMFGPMCCHRGFPPFFC